MTGRGSADRRTVLAAGLGLAGAAALAACSGANHTPRASPTSPPAGHGPYTGDLEIAALGAALENLAVAGYGAVLAHAAAGTYGIVAPAVVRFATTAKAQHTAHAGAWNALLTAAGAPAVSGTPLDVAPGILGQLTAAQTVPAVLKVAAALESSAAATFLEAVGSLAAPHAIGVAASIAPVEAQHAAILDLLLGDYPVPASYLTPATAVRTASLTT